jgi:hypothetical protein
MSRICFGLLLVCGNFVTGAPVPREIHVRLIDIETGKPAEGLYVDLIGGKGKEARSKPPVPPSAVPTAWQTRTDTTAPTSIDGVTPAIVYYRDGFGLKTGEVSMFKVVGIYSDVVDGSTGGRYVSCADQAIFRTDEVLKYGSTVKNLDPWCPNKKAPAQVQAAPGELVMFVRSMKGMPAAEIRVRVIEIDTLKPVKGLYVEAGQVVPTSYGRLGAVPNSNVKAVRVPTSVDGVAHFSVPAPSSREIRDTGYFMVTAIVFPSDEHWCTLSYSVGEGGTIEEVLKYGSKPVVRLVDSRGCNSVSRYLELEEVEAAPGEIVAFVRHLTWWERIHNWFYYSIQFGDQTIH